MNNSKILGKGLIIPLKMGITGRRTIATRAAAENLAVRRHRSASLLRGTAYITVTTAVTGMEESHRSPNEYGVVPYLHLKCTADQRIR